MKYQHPRYLFRRYEIMRKVKQANRFLEIGPGNLALAQELLTRFAQGTLIDFNPIDVQAIYTKLEDSYKQRLTLIIADFLAHSFTQRFDCIVACEVLEHIADDRLFLQKAHQLLVDNGQLIISVPARKKYWSQDDEIVGHYRRYEKQELYDKLTGTGYIQIDIAAYGFPFQNLIRLGRIFVAWLQYSEKAKWSQEKRSQQSAFMVRQNSALRLAGLVLNKYTLYPFHLFASLFNHMDLAEGYVVLATKA